MLAEKLFELLSTLKKGTKLIIGHGDLGERMNG